MLWDHRGRDWKDAGMTQGMPNSAPEAGRGKKGFFPRTFRGSVPLLIPWYLSSGLQDFQRVNFCCFKPPFCGKQCQKLTHMASLDWSEKASQKSKLINWHMNDKKDSPYEDFRENISGKEQPGQRPWGRNSLTFPRNTRKISVVKL